MLCSTKSPRGYFFLYIYILGHDIFLHTVPGLLEIWHWTRSITRLSCLSWHETDKFTEQKVLEEGLTPKHGRRPLYDAKALIKCW